MRACVRMCVRTVGSNYSQYDGTSSGSETAPLNPAPERGAVTSKLEHQTLLDIDNPEQNANSFGRPFESSVSTRQCIQYNNCTVCTIGANSVYNLAGGVVQCFTHSYFE